MQVVLRGKCDAPRAILYVLAMHIARFVIANAV